MRKLGALSVSERVLAELEAGPARGRVLAAFEGACDLGMADGRIVALVLPRVGNGPLNVVLDAEPGDLGALRPGQPALFRRTSLCAGGLRVDLAGAAAWNPRPDWERLRAQRLALGEALPAVRAVAMRLAPEGSLMGLLPSGVAGPLPRAPTFTPILAAAYRGARDLSRGRPGRAGLRLAGLGAGLTPAGDDFLAGVMLWAWLALEDPVPLCRCLAETAQMRTTALSAAFLGAAARGECSAAWHGLFAAVAAGTSTAIAAAVARVLACGATSGADALAGFLWMAEQGRSGASVSPPQRAPTARAAAPAGP